MCLRHEAVGGAPPPRPGHDLDPQSLLWASSMGTEGVFLEVSVFIGLCEDTNRSFAPDPHAVLATSITVFWQEVQINK